MQCRNDTENTDPKMVRTKNNRWIMQSKCSVCEIKKSRFVKEQEVKGLLSNSGIKTPCFALNVIPLSIKMNEVVNKFLLVGDKLRFYL